MRSAALALALTLAAPAVADDLQALSRDFWTWRAVTKPMDRDDVGRVVRPHGWTPDWSLESIETRRRTLALFEGRWVRLADASKPVPWQVDRRLIGSALARVRWELDVKRSWRRDPVFWVDQTLPAVAEALLSPPPFEKERSEDVVLRLESIPRTLDEARAALDEAAAPFAKLAIDDLRAGGPKLKASMAALAPLLAPDARGRVAAATGAAVAALDSFRVWLEARVPLLPDRRPVGRDGYVFFLRNVALMPFTPEELLLMGRQEYERSVALEVVERQRNAGAPEIPMVADQAAQSATTRRAEAEIRGFLEEKGILSVPAWIPHYEDRPVPAYLEALDGFAEWTLFANTARPGEPSIRWIPKPSPKLGYFAGSMARDRRPHMSHEGVPGHAFQLALAGRHDDEIRRAFYDSGPVEGLAFYSEELLQSAGLYADAPKTREMVANYMRLRALRVEVDVKLALGTFTIPQAAEVLRTSVPMDAETARAEAASFASSPGQAITYQIGKLQVQRLLAEAKRAQGDAFRLRAFHDFVYRNGNVPLSLQRWELLGQEDDLK
ncbi:MAG TPA: DUF885 family protein [Thermoanaerobaculia bacterium]|jgi:hypothetical protein